MEINLDQVMDIVEQESEILEALTDLLYRQKDAAIKGELELLDKLTRKQTEAYARICELEAKRLELIAPLAEELEVAPEEVTISLLEQSEAGGNKSRWERLQRMIRPLIAKVKRAGQINNLLFKRCLELGEVRIKNFIRYRAKNETYGLKGDIKSENKDSGVIFNKQI